jgi:16S rRNA (guanine527-N7)-methyltransferase
MSLATKLEEGVSALELSLDAATQRKLLEYVALIAKWNRVHNLTAVRDSAQMVGNHLLDCLAVLPHLATGTIADVGSGAGLPGIPLALARPAHAVTLIESNHKKAAFLRQAVIELKLGNVEVVSERVETWQPPSAYDIVISRAFSDLPEFVQLAGRLCAPGGTLAAMKGVHPYEELAQLPGTFKLRSVLPLKIPGMRAERHLVLLDPA